jgi:hypothetical protein
MPPELTERLRDEFPEIFVLYNDPNNHAEINVDGGWFPLIHHMCAELSALPTVPKISFIKEKFGELRVFMEDSSTEAAMIRAFTERQSLQVCEICGDHGARIDSEGVFKTVCAKHRNFMQERRRLRGY